MVQGPLRRKHKFLERVVWLLHHPIYNENMKFHHHSRVKLDSMENRETLQEYIEQFTKVRYFEMFDIQEGVEAE